LAKLKKSYVSSPTFITADSGISPVVSFSYPITFIFVIAVGVEKSLKLDNS
jgi:hypothetical protein